ncbi:MAG: 4-alpha-glucanotransferase [Erysipelotrichaceae bacterium]|nr:4-alpha-glucanotransferase [Erysipelotrichaceae bacterium]
MSIERSSGILLPVFSLPSRYGIGTLGKEAYKFVDFLAESAQRYWQMLPIGPTSYGDSPYASFSSFAGNPYFIDLDILIEQGLLERKDVRKLKVADPADIDYGYIYETRFEVLHKAYERGMQGDLSDFYRYIEENRDWLDDYGLFMALKRHFGMKSWIEWPDKAIRLRHQEAMEKYTAELREDIRFYQFLQYLFEGQYAALKRYAHEKGVRIIGDLPIYVALDSADCWADPDQFQLTSVNVPREVAGVPPDYFSEDGQLWGNPLYNWRRMKKDGYQWWIRRIKGSARYFDVLRIDHFRGLQAYWAVPYGDTNARRGRWLPGPGLPFVKTILKKCADVEFIAEDLGIISEDVDRLLADSGLPGMKVIAFGMEAYVPNRNTPHNFIPNCVCYFGTHDNSPIQGWIPSVTKKDLEYTKKYFHITDDKDFNYAIIRGAMASVSNLVVFQMQDYLNLGEEARINCPGTLGNWKWRLVRGQYNKTLARKIAEMTEVFGRK